MVSQNTLVYVRNTGQLDMKKIKKATIDRLSVSEGIRKLLLPQTLG